MKITGEKWSGQKQKELRLKLKYSQNELGRLCKTRQSTIRSIEEGCQPRIDTAIKIAKVLKKNLNYFVDN